jgi:predicted amidohydrolase YtcJ
MAARLAAYVVVAIVAATLIAGLIVGAQRDDSEGLVDLIVTNGQVYTADRRGTMAEAVAVRGNQIIRVGTNREIARLQRPQTVVIDARGGTVLPGFNDAHLQLIDGGLTLASIDLAGADGVADTLERIGAWAAANPGTGWVVGRGWSAEHFRGGLPSRQLLDSVVQDRPALMYGADESSVWVNSKALRAAQLTRRTADPADGLIVREPRSGEPAGVLQGSARALVASLVPAPTREQRAEALRSAIAEANALGITSAQNPGDSPESLELYRELRRSGDLTLRLYSAMAIASPLSEADLARLADIRKEYPDDPLLKSGALSIRLDGTVISRQAAMLQPYEGSVEAAEASGDLSFTPDELNRTVRLADAAGWQVITHANGDRAVRTALNAYAHAVRSNRPPARGRRHRIENMTIVDPADLSRFGPLGIVASMQPIGGSPTPHTTVSLSQDLGKERAALTFAARSAGKETKLVFGSGWPANALNPMLGLLVATSQTTPDGTPEGGWHPTERVGLKAAIDAYTSAAAWASFDDQRKGSISPGMMADLVVLSDDIFLAPAAKLASVSVAVTIFDGKIVYRRVPRGETLPAPSLQD